MSMYKARNYNQAFCSRECRDDWHNQIKAHAMEMYRKHLASVAKDIELEEA